MSVLGVVAIGRNEGERLRPCLGSVRGRGVPYVYVDSGSTDGSVALARSMGAEVVELDASRPLSAARARNEGFARLAELAPGVEYVQFVDGDCEFHEGWLARARDELAARPDVAIVCGRLRERFPGHSPYNRLADLEWDGPTGEIRACGGILMVRAGMFRAVGGFDASVIAAEDDEFCLRVRLLGGKVVRLDAEMASHDMNMTRLGQWWRRSVRTGFAYANGVALHGRTPERHFLPQLRGVLFWGAIVPLLALVPAWWTRGASLVLLAGYPVLFWRTLRHGRRRGWSASDARLYAAFCVLGKFPQALGAAKYQVSRLLGRQGTIIEHKGPGIAVTPASTAG